MWLGHKVFGALEPTAATIIASELGQLSKSSTLVNDVLSIFQKHVSEVSEEKAQQFKLELESLLGQIDLDKIDEQSTSLYKSGWRPYLAWGLASALLMSVLVEPTINYMCGFFGIHTPEVFQLSPIVLTILSGLLGLHITARSVEKINNAD